MFSNQLVHAGRRTGGCTLPFVCTCSDNNPTRTATTTAATTTATTTHTLLLHYSHAIGDGTSAYVLAHDLGRAVSLIAGGYRPHASRDRVPTLPPTVDTALWGASRRPTLGQRVLRRIAQTLVLVGYARPFLRNVSPLMPANRGAAAIGGIATSRVRSGSSFASLLAAASAHKVRLNAVLTAAGCFARAALQAAGWRRTRFSYDTSFAVALRSADRCHPDGLFPSATDVVFSPSAARVSGTFDGSETFWSLAVRLQAETDESMTRRRLADTKAVTMALHPYLRRGRLPLDVAVVGDIDVLNLGVWPYPTADFEHARVESYRLFQLARPGMVTPGIMQMWLAALPSGAFTWTANYARPAFPSRDDATAFLEAFVDLTLDLPLRATDVTVADWVASLDETSPFILYGNRYREETQ
mmetsp:Transcript_2653/g.8514  ORF Transcript_2653/g.8514 Transcript_2653/m.8514 type:complete len:413 (-) Transcript_2653:124-1362(-)